MQRRRFISSMVATGFVSVLPSSGLAASDIQYFHSFEVADEDIQSLERSRDYWREKLDSDAWRVLFQEATEPAYSSELDGFYEKGSYVCAACHLPLFTSDTKYDSRTGWPSFWRAYEEHIGTKRDFRMLWPRTEYHCIRCGGHQGHVFEDGPEPTGERWCNNGLALRFVAADDPLPALR